MLNEVAPNVSKKYKPVFWVCAVLYPAIVLAAKGLSPSFENFGAMVAYVYSAIVVYEVLFNRYVHVPGMGIEPSEQPGHRVFFGIVFSAIGIGSLWLF